MGNLLEKLTSLASKQGDGPLLEHVPVIEFLQYIYKQFGSRNGKTFHRA